MSGLTLWAKDVTYRVKSKVILDGATFAGCSGELTVILGPSGSGKTTLLNALLGRVGKLDAGEVGLNDSTMTDDVSKYLINYVMANDRLNEFLTVEETLVHTARLKLPHRSVEECKAIVNKLIMDFHLDECRDLLVGGTWRKGVSKGQLKRICVAQELIGDPAALILDEPTTGLDSSLSFELVKMLKDIAIERNIVVVCTLHQPNQRMYDLFDKICVMSGGQFIYQGPATEAIPFFQEQGRLKDLAGSSVPDTLLELASELIPETSRRKFVAHSESTLRDADGRIIGRRRRGSVVHYVKFEQSYPTTESVEGRDEETSMEEFQLRKLVDTSPEVMQSKKMYLESRYYAATKQCVEEAKQTALNTHLDQIDTVKDAQSWGSQARIVFLTYWTANRRNPLSNLIIMLSVIVQALLLGAVFFQTLSDVKDIQDDDFRTFSVWQNYALRFVDYGLTNDEKLTAKDRVDPLRTLMAKGTDGDGSSTIFDVAGNPDMAKWMLDFVKCARTNIQLDDSVYPKWDWTGQSSGTPAPLASGDVCWNWVNSYSETSFPQMDLYEAMTGFMGALQIFDMVMQQETGWPSFEFDGVNMLSWLGAFGKMEPWAYLFLCCAGNPVGFVTMFNAECAGYFPNAEFATFPGRMYWPDAEGRMVTYNEDGPDVMGALRNTLRGLQQSPELVELASATALHFKENVFNVTNSRARLRRRLSTPRYQKMLSDVLPADFFTDHGRTQAQVSMSSARLMREVQKQAGLQLTATKRRLGSGLSGMVTDLVNLIMNNPNSPVFKLMVGLQNVLDRLASDSCNTRYCEIVTNFVTDTTLTVDQVAATVLTILNVCGVCFFLAANLGFSSYDVLLQFPKDRAIFNRERANGMYRSSAFLIGKMCAEFPFHVVPGVTWALIYFLMVGFQGHLGHNAAGAYTAGIACTTVLSYIGVAALISFTAYSMGYLISSLVYSLELSIILSPLILIAMLMLAGFFLRDQTMPGWIGWAKYISIYRWGYFAVMILIFPPGRSFGLVPNAVALMLGGVTDPILWHSCLYLLAISLGCRGLTFLSLKFLYATQGTQS